MQALFSSIVGPGPNYDTSIAYKEIAGTSFQIVATNGNKVIFWSNGYREFTEFGPSSCYSTAWLQTHPPGFYQISKSKIMYCIPNEEYNTIPKGKENNVVAKGITTSDLNIRMTPSKNESPIAMFSSETEISLASTKKIKAIDGSNDTYYKIIYQGYMSKKRYCYVNTLYVNIDINSDKKPKDLKDAFITNIDLANIYAKKDKNSKIIGGIDKQISIQYRPSGSNKEWTEVWFSGQKGYVLTKYIQKGYYTVVKNTSDLGIKKIVKNQYVVSWNPTNTNKGYSIAIVSTDDPFLLGKDESYWLYINKNYNKTEFTIDNSYFKNGNTYRNKIYFRVTAIDGSQTCSIPLSRLTVHEETKKPTWDGVTVEADDISIVFGKYGAYDVQLATDSKFKKQIVPESGSYYYGLKPNTTYYIRYRNKQEFTSVDNKIVGIYSKWSSTKKIKTKKARVSDYVEYVNISNVKNGQYVVSWYKVPGAKSYTVRVIDPYDEKVAYSNKNYKKDTLTIKKEWFNKLGDRLYVTVQANKKTQYIEYGQLELFCPNPDAPVENTKVETTIYSFFNKEDVVVKCRALIGVYGHNDSDNPGMQVQISTDKNFKNATTLKNPHGYAVIIKNLDVGETYYYRYRYMRTITLPSGEKYLYGDNWSKAIKFTTQTEIPEEEISG